MLLIVLEVSFFLIIIIRNIYNNKPSTNSCITKFNCGLCNEGITNCSYLNDYNEVEDIICPCDSN